MTKSALRYAIEEPAAEPAAREEQADADRRPADAEMARVLGTTPFRMALDSSGAGIAHWKHDHCTTSSSRWPITSSWLPQRNGQRFERRDRKSDATGTTRPGVVTIIPAGSSSRWDIPRPLMSFSSIFRTKRWSASPTKPKPPLPAILLERTAHPDPITSRLLLSAADALEGNATLDTLFRHQLTDLLATRLLAAHAGSPATFQPAIGGLSPKVAAPRHRTPALGQRCGRLARRAGVRSRAVALPFLPRLQGKHRAFAACLAAPTPARAGHEHAARHRRNRSFRSQPRLATPRRPPSPRRSGS